MRKKKIITPENQLLYELGNCSKHNNLKKALSLYESALTQNLNLSPQHFNSILHLCSTPEALNSSDKSAALEYGFRVYNDMEIKKIPPTEATISQIARLAAAKNDPDYGFDLIKKMSDLGVVPKLRTYGPTLCSFCDNLRIDDAYEVEEHMGINGVRLEEGEFCALLKVSAEVGRSEKVYEYLHKLRGVVRGVSEETAKVVEGWFSSAKASEVGAVEWDVGRYRVEKEKNGGGWHGLGWIGKGDWVVKRVGVREDGKCCGCGDMLVCVDIDCGETERFAQSVASLAMERESNSNFKYFMDWLENRSGYEAIVDAANIGLYQQNFKSGGFSVAQLEGIVRELYVRNKKWPLVILHNKRVRTLQGNPSCRKLFDELLAQGALYATPTGSNDDWYWLYAAVKLKCLLITNDEMRDHIFELLGSSFFLQWKERHQVHYTFAKGSPILTMPPPYSILIQESEIGCWHVPIASENPRNWLCIRRSNTSSVPSSFSNFKPLLPYSNGIGQAHHHSGERITSVTGKRKERNPSPSGQQ